MAAFRHPRWRIWNIAGGEIRFALTDLPPELRETISTLAEQIDAHRKHVLSLGRGLLVTDFGGFMRVLASLAPASERPR